MEHVKRDFQIPEEHFFLFGPRGREKLKRDHILILPCEDFLRNLPNHLTAR